MGAAADANGAAGEATRAHERPAPLKLFVSYAHEDDRHRAALAEHLAPLIDADVFKLWHDRRLSGGQDWAGRIDQHLAEADIVLLLVSRHFLASDYCKGVEVTRALAMEAAGQVRVVPVVLSSCAWTDAPIGRLQALPADGRPIVESEHPNRLYLEVVQGLKLVAGEVRPGLFGLTDATRVGPIVGGERAAGPQKPNSIPQPPRPSSRLWQVIAGLVCAIVLAASVLAWKAIRLKADADDALRIDRPDLAREVLEPAPRWLDAWPGIEALRRTARLHDESRKADADGTRIERELAVLLKQRPNDAHLLFVRARRAFLQGSDEGIEAVQAALDKVLEADRRYAAAESLLGLLADRIGKVDVAAVRHAKALEMAPEVPPYLLNHARSLLDQGKAAEARAAYAQVDGNYALASVEAALAAWALGRPGDADNLQARALKLLDDPKVMAQVANRGDWLFIYPDAEQPGQISEQVVTGGAKRCYVDTELAISASFSAIPLETGAPSPMPPSCSDRVVNKQISQLVAADLCRYVIQAGEAAAAYVERAESWRAKLGVRAACAPGLRGRRTLPS